MLRPRLLPEPSEAPVQIPPWSKNIRRSPGPGVPVLCFKVKHGTHQIKCLWDLIIPWHPSHKLQPFNLSGEPNTSQLIHRLFAFFIGKQRARWPLLSVFLKLFPLLSAANGVLSSWTFTGFGVGRVKTKEQRVRFSKACQLIKREAE